MVYKFLDMFPEDLLGLPPDREIEFFPRTPTISKSPYQMAMELKDLRKQLQELLDKKFIHPVISYGECWCYS